MSHRRWTDARATIGAVVAMTGVAHADGARAEPTWLVRLAWGNDLFSELPPADDAGLTNDLEVAVARAPARAGTTIGGAVRHRMITERGGDRRRDQVDVAATASRDARRGDVALTATARAGLTLTGNLGGRWLQDGWHGVTGTGPTIEQGLQHRYEGDHRVALVVGGRGEVRALGGALEPYAALDAQLALGGTGLSLIELAGGVRVPLARGRVVVTAEGALFAQTTADPGLALDGGYGGGSTAWRLGVEAGSRATRVGWQYRADEGGSGEPIGVVWLGLRR